MDAGKRMRVKLELQRMAPYWWQVPDWFRDDGCTGVPDHGNGTPCRLHDWRYWLGGEKRYKELADWELRVQVEKTNFIRGWVWWIGLKVAQVLPWTKNFFHYEGNRIGRPLGVLRETYLGAEIVAMDEHGSPLTAKMRWA